MPKEYLQQIRDGLIRRQRSQLDPIQVAQQPTIDGPLAHHPQPHRIVDNDLDLIRGGTLIGAAGELGIELEHTYTLSGATDTRTCN